MNKNFPIIFRSLKSTCNKMEASYTNEKEVDVVVSCLNELFKVDWKGRKVNIDDIGIITPYSGQRRLIQIRTSLLGNIAIKSPESFQGQERNIIIVSTVRTDDLGFVRDKNVCQALG